MISTNKKIPNIPAMVVLLAFTPPSIPTSPIAGKHTKARLIEEVPKMQRLALKKVKGLSSEESVVRNDLVLALPDGINAISDGAAAAPKQSGGWGGSGSCAEIKFDSGPRFGGHIRMSGYFEKHGQ